MVTNTVSPLAAPPPHWIDLIGVGHFFFDLSRCPVNYVHAIDFARRGKIPNFIKSDA